MTALLKPGIYKILQVFYREKSGRIHLRALAREAGMQGQSITRYLNVLEKEKILVSEKKANLRQYRLTHNRLAYALLALLDVERLQKLPLLRKNAILSYLDALPSPPVFAVVFGSTAKGTYSEKSDIDILIITQKRVDTKSAQREADAKSAMRISTFQMEYFGFMKELKLKEDQVMQSALESGFPVLNHVSYYEALFHERV